LTRRSARSPRRALEIVTTVISSAALRFVPSEDLHAEVEGACWSLLNQAATIEGAKMSQKREKAVLAGGCFWGMQDLIRRRPGVLSTRVGYTGGDVANATYRNHGTHAEAIEIVFDPEVTSYRELLEFFFQIHDPTTLNRQGNDIGPSYRSAIFYLDEEQRRVAEDTSADVEASGLWPGKVVTEVTPAGPFWEAEPEHQDYLERYPNGYTCHFPRPGWVLPHRSAAAR
jgi:peptide-methionine (S)-S-oxide reductase